MDTSTPPPSPLTNRRPTDFRVCKDENSGVGGPSGNTADALGRPWGVAPIDFSYSIETDVSSGFLTNEEKDAILASVSTAIIDSVYEYGCFPQRGRKRRRQSAMPFSSSLVSRRTEILSISPGIGHEWLGDCDVQSSSSNNAGENESFCSEIRGTVTIAFDEKNLPDSTDGVASDFESVGNVVLSRIEEDMTSGNYVDKINNDLRRFGRVIYSMKYIDSDYQELVAQDAFSALDWSNLDGAESVGMSRFSKLAIPIMVILSLIAMVLCWCAVMSCPADSFFANLLRSKEERRREKDLKQKRLKESKASLSLEATLQDLSDIEVKKYGDQNPVYSRSPGNKRSSPTVPIRNTKSARDISRFSPVSDRDSPQSTMHFADGTFHTTDTETGSIGRSIEDYPPSRGRMSTRKADEERRNTTPIRLLSSLFGKSNATEVTPAPTLMERISSCAPNNNCLVDDPKNKCNNNGTMMRYVVPPVERNNSLIDESEPPQPNILRSRTSPNTASSPTPAMGKKKSAAYRKYINEKILQRNAECEHLDNQALPMEIGVKRTFTDAQGQIREMVAL